MTDVRAPVVEQLERWEAVFGKALGASVPETLEERLRAVQRWHASRMAMEHLTWLSTCRLIAVDGLSLAAIRKYLLSREGKRPAIGRLCAVGGIAAPVALGYSAVLPLLEAAAYRPYLPAQVVRALSRLCTSGLVGWPGLPGAIADLVLEQSLTPSVACGLVKSLGKLGASGPAAAQYLPAVVAELRRAAQDVVASGDGVASIIDSLAAASAY